MKQVEFTPGPDPMPQFVEVVVESTTGPGRFIVATSEIEIVRAESDEGRSRLWRKGTDEDDPGMLVVSPSYDELADLLVRRPALWRERMRFFVGVDVAQEADTVLVDRAVDTRTGTHARRARPCPATDRRARSADQSGRQ